MSRKVESLHRTKFLELVQSGKWHWVSRPHPVVCIVAMTGEQHVLLIEQYRVPVDARVIELPAGLVGDAEESKESIEDAGRRELLEETGYEASSLNEIFVGVTSAGLTDEITTFLLATDVRKVSPATGSGDEQIQQHLVPLDQVDLWLEQRRSEGKKVDARVIAGLYFLRREAGKR